jgi:hypothetical protein
VSPSVFRSFCFPTLVLFFARLQRAPARRAGSYTFGVTWKQEIGGWIAGLRGARGAMFARTKQLSSSGGIQTPEIASGVFQIQAT